MYSNMGLYLVGKLHPVTVGFKCGNYRGSGKTNFGINVNITDFFKTLKRFFFSKYLNHLKSSISEHTTNFFTSIHRSRC